MSDSSGGGPQQPKRGSVLVVDDSRLVRAVVARHLRNNGYGVDEAENGQAALRRLADQSYDVIITDLGMPELDGFGVLAAVKKLSPSVEVIILTGTHSQDMSAAVRALRLGAHDYLTKPPGAADDVVLTVERAMEKKRLKDANQHLLNELRSQSRTDVLTGIPNRRAFDDALQREIPRAGRHGHSLGLVMLDIDHFKQVNDTFGHQAGDEVLRVFARVASTVLREGDVLYRYGGEEFAAVLPHADMVGATTAGERIVAAISAHPFRVGSSPVSITTSAGVACWPGSGADAIQLVEQADSALYEAKKAGRNRVVAVATHRPRLAMVKNRNA
jgi:two-component system cell cycle response regulator